MKTKLNKNIIKNSLTLSTLILVFSLTLYFFINSDPLKLRAQIFNLEETNGGVTLNINDVYTVSNNDKKYVNFSYEDTKTVKVTVDFDDTSSENKQIVIDLVEGMTYRSYPVLTTTSNNIETVISPDDNLYSAIKNVEAPTIIDNGPIGNTFPNMKYSSYGKLIYNINSNVSKVEISFNVMVDQFRFYGDKYADNAIKVGAFIGDAKVGLIEKNLFYNGNGNFKIGVGVNNIVSYTDRVLPSSDTVTNYGSTKATYINAVYKFDNGTSQSYIPYFKKMIYDLYLPEGMTYSSSNTYVGNYYGTYDDVIVEDDNVKIIFNSYKYHAYGYGLNYAVGKLDAGTYMPNNFNSILIQYYDETDDEFSKYLMTSTSGVEVVDPSSIYNKLKVRSSPISEDNNDDTLVYGPSFVVSNEDPDTKTNQVLEFVIDPNYQVSKVNFPKPTTGWISNICYKTNKTTGNDCIMYNGSINNNTSLFTFTYIMAGLADDEYFTNIKATISSYQAGYYSSKAAANSTANATLFGNLKSKTMTEDSFSNTATVEFYTYSSDDYNSDCYSEDTTEACKTWTRNSSQVKYTNVLSSSPDTSISYYKFNKSTVNAGDSFSLNATLITHSYPYGTRLYIDDTQIYLREPKGLSLNLSSTKIYGKVSGTTENTELDYTYTTHKNKFGDTIYIIDTDYTVGRYFTKTALVNSLVLSTSYSVENDCEISSIAFDQLMSWGSKNYTTIQNYNFKDLYDFNGNGNYEENIFETSNATIAIQPSKSVVISTKIVKDDVESSPYNPENINTILNLYQDETFDYNVKIKNNTDGEVTDYTLYLPIPKTGYDYGEKFQSSPFSWDMKLSSKPTLPEGYNIEYSLNKTRSIISNLSSLTFTSDINDSDLKNVTMIKVTATKTLSKGDSDSFNISLLPDETKETGIEKINTVNVWNPVSVLTSTSISGEFKGNSVATKLLIPEISGIIYEDNDLDGTYNKDVDLFGINATASLYKLVNNEYKQVEDAVISIDQETGKYDISDSKYLSEGTYAIKFNIPSDYNILEDDKVNLEGWVTGINVLGEPVTAPNIRVIKYNLDFEIDNEIISVDETREISIKNILPDYFETIKNTDVTYSWNVLDEFNDCITVENENSITSTINGLKACKSAMLEASIYDKYNHKLTKGFTVTIKQDKSLIINSKDISIYVGDKIEFEKYIISAYDYMEKEIKLSYKDNANIMYESTISNDKDIATKPGTYQIKYTITDANGNVGTKIVKVNVKEKTTGQIIIDAITSPKTNDKVRSYIIGFLVSFAVILIMCILYLKRKNKRTV